MISDNLVKLVEANEGWSAIPYRDSCGVCTIGFGFTHYPNGAPVTMQDEAISREQGIELLDELLTQFIHGINALCINCNQNQKDALTDFAYNEGLGSLRGSALLKLVRANPNDAEIANRFKEWVYAGKEILPGLIKRRANEVKLYFTPLTVE